jgi:hypothetical protein
MQTAKLRPSWFVKLPFAVLRRFGILRRPGSGSFFGTMWHELPLTFAAEKCA